MIRESPSPMLSPGPRDVSYDDFCIFERLNPDEGSATEGSATAGASGDILDAGAAGCDELDWPLWEPPCLTRLMRGRLARSLESPATPMCEEYCNRRGP